MLSNTIHTHTSRIHDVDRRHAPFFVFMRGVTRQCYNSVRVENVHHARCQRRWARPPAHGAVTGRDTPTGRWRGAARLGCTGTTSTPPAMRATGPPPPDSPFPRRVPHVPQTSVRAGGWEKFSTDLAQLKILES